MKRGRPRRPETLITGGRGFIGSRLKGDVWDIKDDNDINFIRGCKGPYKYVIHAAAVHSGLEWMFGTNVDGTRKVVERANEWGAKVIFLSSAAVYGECYGARENSTLQPVNSYGFSKVAGEHIVESLAKEWVILRLSNVYGPGGQGVISKILENKKVQMNYDGVQTRDFIYIDDVLDFILKAKKLRGIFNVSSGGSTSISELFFNWAVKMNRQNPVAHPLQQEIQSSGIGNFKARQAGLNVRTLEQGIDDFRIQLG